MAIKKLDSGKWQVNVQPGGRAGKRVKKSFSTKAEAIAWERHVQAKVQEDPAWAPPKRDARLVKDIIDLWHKHHGYSLNDGEGRLRILYAMCEAMGNPKVDHFTADLFAEYRAKRIDAGIKPSTLNREHSYLRAAFNECIRLDHWKKENPLSKLRAFKVQESELSFLSLDQIAILMDRLAVSKNPHVLMVSTVCLSTGARWGEAEDLRISQVQNCLIQFVKTKSSKARSVPITADFEKALLSHYEEHGMGERLFATAYSSFREAIKATNLKLSDGQLTHILRHSFASHFMMNGGNILALQKLLGHYSLTMTMRYAHLSPDHLEEARRLNPIALLPR